MGRAGLSFGLSVVLGLGLAGGLTRAQDPKPATECLNASKRTPAAALTPESHRFWDRTNLGLFVGVAAVRALHFTSTQHFRERGNNEVLLSNALIDNKPLFASVEVAGVAASVGFSYLLHRKGHHRAERWTSIIHIGVASVGDAHNYSLRRVPAAARGIWEKRLK